jgi:hypothetical protein
MATEAQVAANRRNAEKSTGPRTPQGKAVVSQNAVKHGLLACRDVIRGEEQEEFELYREEMFWELEPVGTVESRLAERIVSLAWRLRRAERIANEAFDALLTKDLSSPLARLTQSLRSRGADQRADDSDGCDGDLSLGRTVVRDFSGARVLDRLLMYERRIERSLYRTMAELQKLRRAEKPQAHDAGIGSRTRRDAKEDTRIKVSGGQCPPYEAPVLDPAGDAHVSKASCLRTAGGTPATRPPADREFMTDCAKQSQLSPVDGVHSPPHESSEASPGEETPYGVITSAGDSAKQSQVPPVDSVHGTPCENGHASDCEQTPDGVTTSAADSAKQSQFPPADAGVCSVPVRASLETQDIASIQSGATSVGDAAKQSQSAGAETVNTGSPKDGEETPYGIATNGEDLACKTKPMGGAETVEPGLSKKSEGAPCGVATNAGGGEKQSQSPAVAPLRKTPAPLRARPRVAYHYHTAARPY